MIPRVSIYYKIYYVGNVNSVLRWCLLIHLQPCYAGCNIRQSNCNLSDFQSLLKLWFIFKEQNASKMIWWRSMTMLCVPTNGYSLKFILHYSLLEVKSKLGLQFVLYYTSLAWGRPLEMECSKLGSIKDFTIDICGASCGDLSSLCSA